MRFGSLLKELREKKNLRQEDLANAIGVSCVYVCDIEKGRRYPPDFGKLRIWTERLQLCNEDASAFFDAAGYDRNEVAPDIIEYMSKHPEARDAIRRIMATSSEYDWNSFRI